MGVRQRTAALAAAGALTAVALVAWATSHPGTPGGSAPVAPGGQVEAAPPLAPQPGLAVGKAAGPTRQREDASTTESAEARGRGVTSPRAPLFPLRLEAVDAATGRPLSPQWALATLTTPGGSEQVPGSLSITLVGDPRSAGSGLHRVSGGHIAFQLE